jgi:hypothetical protein
MKHLSIAIVFILAFSFCKNKTKNNAEFKSELIKNDSTFRLSEHYSKFKFHDLKEFKINQIDFDEKEKYYKKLDSLSYSKFFQKGDYEPFYYYSTFSDTTLIALIGDSEELGPFIYLLKYDKNGKLQTKKDIAGKGCDGGYCIESFGKFIGDNSFVFTDIQSSMIGDEIENADEKVDSLILKIKFDLNNELKIDTILNKTNTIKKRKK